MLKRAWLVLTMPLFLLLLPFVMRQQTVAAPEPTPEVDSSVRFDVIKGVADPNEIFDLANKARQHNGSPVLIANAQLAEVATKRAADMAARQYYAHKSPDGLYYYDLFPAEGVSVDYSCENLDLVFVKNPEKFIEEWLASTRGHRNCLLNEHLTYGGYATTKLTLVDYFGKPTTAYLVVAIHTTDLH